jgi:hypothetical protein
LLPSRWYDTKKRNSGAEVPALVVVGSLMLADKSGSAAQRVNFKMSMDLKEKHFLEQSGQFWSAVTAY